MQGKRKELHLEYPRLTRTAFDHFIIFSIQITTVQHIYSAFLISSILDFSDLPNSNWDYLKHILTILSYSHWLLIFHHSLLTQRSCHTVQWSPSPLRDSDETETAAVFLTYLVPSLQARSVTAAAPLLATAARGDAVHWLTLCHWGGEAGRKLGKLEEADNSNSNPSLLSQLLIQFWRF